MKAFLLLLALPFLLSSQSPSPKYMLVGTYTGGKSEGIYVYTFDDRDGSSTEVSHIRSSNPSYLAVSPDKRFIYAVNENHDHDNGGKISAYSFNRMNGELTFINQQATNGDDPCYVDVDKTGKWVFVANYSSGSLSVFPVGDDGGLQEASTVIRDSGSGPNKDRQEKPHVHCTYVSSDNKWLFVSDLGIDSLMVYRFDSHSGKLTPAGSNSFMTDPGGGPRHISFGTGGRFAYLIEELTGNINVLKYSNGRFTRTQKISGLPKGQEGFAGSADIHVSPDGKFLYATNRGDFNNIVRFRVNAANGQLSSPAFTSCLGKVPRNFNFDPSGNYLLVANQESDEIVAFRRNKSSGLLSDSGKRTSVGKPVCVKWVL